MKTNTVTCNFKTVSKAQAEKTPALADRIGKKRETLKFDYQAYESFSEVPAELEVAAMHFINSAIEQFGREQLLKHASDWNFVPSDLTLAKAYESATAVASRERTLTKATASAFAEFYGKFAPALLGIPQAAANGAKTVISEFSSYSKQVNFCNAMFERFNQLAEKLADDELSEEVTTALAESEIDLMEVLVALIDKFNPANVEIVTADSL